MFCFKLTLGLKFGACSSFFEAMSKILGTVFFATTISFHFVQYNKNCCVYFLCTCLFQLEDTQMGALSMKPQCLVVLK